MNAQAHMLSLRDFNLFSSWPELAFMSSADFDTFIAERALLWTNRPCPICGGPRSITPSDPNALRRKFECNVRTCRRLANRKVGIYVDTFFQRCHADRQKVFLLSYLYINDMGGVAEMARSCQISPRTVVQYNQWFRDILVEYYTLNPVRRMGGPGTVVQLDETCVVRRKFNQGRLVRKDWLVGGIQDGTRMAFFEITGRRNAATLQAIIQRHVAPGGILLTDQWAGYANLGNLGYTHRTVNHSVGGVPTLQQDAVAALDASSAEVTEKLERFLIFLPSPQRLQEFVDGTSRTKRLFFYQNDNSMVLSLATEMPQNQPKKCAECYGPLERKIDGLPSDLVVAHYEAFEYVNQEGKTCRGLGTRYMHARFSCVVGRHSHITHHDFVFSSKLKASLTTFYKEWIRRSFGIVNF